MLKKQLLIIIPARSGSKTIKNKKEAGINKRKAFKAKNICISIYKSCGVNPTPAKKIEPIAKKIEPTKASLKFSALSLKRYGTYKKAIPAKKNKIKENPKKKDERKFTSPE